MCSSKMKSSRRELAEARKHLAEALEQQTATSEVLQGDRQLDRRSDGIRCCERNACEAAVLCFATRAAYVPCLSQGAACISRGATPQSVRISANS